MANPENSELQGPESFLLGSVIALRVSWTCTPYGNVYFANGYKFLGNKWGDGNKIDDEPWSSDWAKALRGLFPKTDPKLIQDFLIGIYNNVKQAGRPKGYLYLQFDGMRDKILYEKGKFSIGVRLNLGVQWVDLKAGDVNQSWMYSPDWLPSKIFAWCPINEADD